MLMTPGKYIFIKLKRCFEQNSLRISDNFTNHQLQIINSNEQLLHFLDVLNAVVSRAQPLTNPSPGLVCYFDDFHVIVIVVKFEQKKTKIQDIFKVKV